MIAASSALQSHSIIADTMQFAMPCIRMHASKQTVSSNTQPSLILERDVCIDGKTIRLCSSTSLLRCAMRKASQRRVYAHVNLVNVACGSRRRSIAVHDAWWAAPLPLSNPSWLLFLCAVHRLDMQSSPCNACHVGLALRDDCCAQSAAQNAAPR